MGRPVRYRRITSKAWLADTFWMRSRRRLPWSVRRQKVPVGDGIVQIHNNQVTLLTQPVGESETNGNE